MTCFQQCLGDSEHPVDVSHHRKMSPVHTAVLADSLLCSPVSLRQGCGCGPANSAVTST